MPRLIKYQKLLNAIYNIAESCMEFAWNFTFWTTIIELLFLSDNSVYQKLLIIEIIPLYHMRKPYFKYEGD